MGFDIEGARKSGYSDAEIADYLASQNKFNAAGARKSGYSDTEIIDHLVPSGPKQGPPDEREKISPLKSELEGYLSSASLNFRDELKGTAEASGLPGFLGGFRIPVGAARLGYEYLTGKEGEKGTATQEYERARDEQRALSKAAAEANPGASLIGGLGGAVALPGGAALKGASLLGRAGRGALVGGAYGGLSGVGEGEDLQSRLTEGAKGAALGGVLGGAAPPVVEGLIGAGRIAATPFKPLMNALRPENEAARRVAGAISRDVEIDPAAVSRVTPQEMAANPSVINADLGGENTRALARSAANTSPEARLALNQAVNPRYQTQGDRLPDWLESNLNFTPSVANRMALETSAKSANQTAYAKAYQAGAQPMASPELARLAKTDIVQQAMKRASTAASDEAVVQGRTYQPYDLRYWDKVRQEVPNEGIGKEVRKQLNAELDNLVPEYKGARQSAKSFFDADNALEAGENFVRLNKDLATAKAEFAKMSATEQKLFQDGFLSRYVDDLRKLPDRSNVLNKINQSPAAKDKLRTILGPQKTDETEAMLRVEDLMNKTRENIQGNSTSVRQYIEAGIAGGAGGLGGAYFSGDWKGAATGILTMGLARGKFKVDQNVATKVGQMLASDDPQIVRNGIKLLARNKNMMESLRGIDQQIAKTAGAQSE